MKAYLFAARPENQELFQSKLQEKQLLVELFLTAKRGLNKSRTNSKSEIIESTQHETVTAAHKELV